MSVITPNTDLILLKNPLELDNRNQLTFTNKEAQFNYFNSLDKLVADNFTYQRQDEIIRFPGLRDDLLEYNYCMYRNSSYSDKWFYAFIIGMDYINDSMTAIHIKSDSFQNWQFDLTYKTSFIEREHVNDDTIGLHTLPENLETGEYITKEVIQPDFGESHPVIMVTEYCYETYPDIESGYIMNDDSRIKSGGGILNGVYQGCMMLLCGDKHALESILTAYAKAGKSDSVVAIFMSPDYLTGYSIPLSSSNGWHFTDYTPGFVQGPFKYLSSTISDSTRNHDISKPYNNIDGVVPKNNKLFTSPYIYLMGTNNQGQSAIYPYEYFTDVEVPGFARFQSKGVLTPGCSIRAVPINYKGVGYNNSEGINLGKFPVCSYLSDVYTNWLTQNGVNIGLSALGSVAQIAGGTAIAVTGVGAVAGASAIASGVLGIANSLATVYEHSLIPPQLEGNVNCGDVNYSSGYNAFSFYKMNIKAEMVSIIDNYFSMFGYKVNSVKQPNISGRQNWNYVKTIDCNIEAFIPQKDLQEIKDMFNMGVTLWHNPTTFLDYSQSNSII